MKVRLFIRSLLVVLTALTVSTVMAQDSETPKCTAGFRLITHAMGKVCVSEQPQRVVTLEWSYTEDVLALGVQPVGVADIKGYDNWVKIPIALDASVQDVGTRQQPNLEVIAKLNPDLIITPDFRLADNYDELSAIAPTLVFAPYPTDGSSHYDEMINTMQTLATALGRESQGQAVLQHLNDHYAAAKAALEQSGHGGESFILSQGWNDEQVATFRLFTENAMAVQILERIGLKNAWNDAPQQYGYTEVGIEGFAQLANSDFNFFYVAQGEDNTLFEQSALWSKLPFVQNGHTYWMGGDVWLFGGPYSAELLVDTVLTRLGVPLPSATLEPTAEVSATP